MRKLTLIVGIFFGIVVVVAIGLFVLRDQLDVLVDGAIETHASRLTGTRVTVGDVELDVSDGRARLADIRVANPDGFSARDALVLGEIVLDIDPATIRSQPHVVEELTVDSVTVLYELAADGRRNLDVIRDHVEAASPSREPQEQTTPPPLLIVERLRLTGGEVEADAATLGVEPRTATFSGFTMEDVGAPDGVAANQVGKRVLSRLLERAVQAAVVDEVKGRLREELGGSAASGS